MKIVNIIAGKNKIKLIFENEEIEISKDIFLDLNFKKDDILTELDVAKIKQESEKYFAKEKALNILSFGMNSQKMLSDKLYQKKYSKIAVDNAINFCKEYGFLNDETYAKAYFETYKRKYGTLKLKNDLKQKGLSKEIIEVLFNEETENDEVECAYNLLLKIISKKDINNQKEKQMIIRRLASKGFNFNVIKKAFVKLQILIDDDE